MYAKFLDQDKLIVNSADESEQFIMADFIKMANSGEYELIINKLLDINGDATGVCIELVKKSELSTPSSEE
jgi:hypothetical protein